jgi:hypothetical protein
VQGVPALHDADVAGDAWRDELGMAEGTACQSGEGGPVIGWKLPAGKGA